MSHRCVLQRCVLHVAPLRVACRTVACCIVACRTVAGSSVAGCTVARDSAQWHVAKRGVASLRRSQGAQSGILILLLVMSWASKADFIRAYSPVAVSVRAVPRRVLPAACRMLHAETVAAFRTLDVAHRIACLMLHVACCTLHVAGGAAVNVACCMLHVAGGAAVHADVDRQPRRGPGQVLQGSDGTRAPAQLIASDGTDNRMIRTDNRMDGTDNRIGGTDNRISVADNRIGRYR
jgi:hypothetical protein